MAKVDKTVVQILSGGSDANIDFNGLCGLLNKFGFDERIKVAIIFLQKAAASMY